MFLGVPHQQRLISLHLLSTPSTGHLYSHNTLLTLITGHSSFSHGHTCTLSLLLTLSSQTRSLGVIHKVTHCLTVTGHSFTTLSLSLDTPSLSLVTLSLSLVILSLSLVTVSLLSHCHRALLHCHWSHCHYPHHSLIITSPIIIIVIVLILILVIVIIIIIIMIKRLFSEPPIPKKMTSDPSTCIHLHSYIIFHALFLLNSSSFIISDPMVPFPVNRLIIIIRRKDTHTGLRTHSHI